MDDKNNELYETLFKELTPVEYLKISKAAIWKTFKSGEVLTRREHLVPDLVLIYNGTVDVSVNGKKVAQLKESYFAKAAKSQEDNIEEEDTSTVETSDSMASYLNAIKKTQTK